MAEDRGVNIPSYEECIRRLRAVSEAAVTITSELTLDKVLQKIADTARDLVHARYAALGVVDFDRKRLVEFVTSGLTQAEIDSIGARPHGLGLLGLLLREPRPIRVKAIGDDPRSVGFPPNHPPMTSFLGVPITSRGRILGNFYMGDKIGMAEFSQEDEDILTLFAAHAAVAIENARLYTETRSTLRRKVKEVERSERQARLLSEIGNYLLRAPLKDELDIQPLLERLPELLGDACSVWLVDPSETVVLRKKAAYHADPARRRAAEEVIEAIWHSLREAVIGQHRSILVPGDEQEERDALAWGSPSDRRGFAGMLATPIAARDKTYGLLVSLVSQPGELTPDDLRFASLVADRLATKMDNIRLYHELDEQTSRLETILDTMAEAVNVADPTGSLVLTNSAYLRLAGACGREDVACSVNKCGRLLNSRKEDGRAMSAEELPMNRSLRGETFTNAVVLIAPIGEPGDRYVSVSGAPIRDEMGQITAR
ncbi:MAG: GAF domain-containing protein [Chloroflexi bacterium]|nr:GAF domain-containing protein [Chloroflexota bacterium]